jgi:hypothetical protein
MAIKALDAARRSRMPGRFVRHRVVAGQSRKGGTVHTTMVVSNIPELRKRHDKTGSNAPDTQLRRNCYTVNRNTAQEVAKVVQGRP